MNIIKLEGELCLLKSINTISEKIKQMNIY